MYKINLLLGDIKCIISVKNMSGAAHSVDVERHTNLQNELHIVLKGNCKIDVDDYEYTLSRDIALIIPKNKFHSLFGKNNDFLHFAVAFELYKNDKEIIPEFAKLSLTPKDIELCFDIIKESHGASSFGRQRVIALYTLLITSLFTQIPLFKSDGKHSDSEHFDDRYFVIDDFFETNLAKNCTERELAKRLHISPRQLNRILVSNYGVTFSQKLANARMDRARWLLRTTDMDITDICEAIGFSSSTSFYKAFKKHCNTTPLKYRKDKSKTL